MTAGCARGPGRCRALALAVLIACAGCGGDAAAPPPPCDDAPALSTGTPFTGSLGPGDRRWGGAFIEYWAIHPHAPRRAQVVVSTASFDPFVLLLDHTGTVIDQAYMPLPPTHGPRTVTIERTLIGPCYMVGVTTWQRDATGGYLIALAWTSPAP